jgi:hypothetical protein
MTLARRLNLMPPLRSQTALVIQGTAVEIARRDAADLIQTEQTKHTIDQIQRLRWHAET